MNMQDVTLILGPDGRVDFWRTMFRLWARYIPFWTVVGIVSLAAWLMFG